MSEYVVLLEENDVAALDEPFGPGYPVVFDQAVNTEGHEVAPYVDPDQRYLLYTLSGPESATVVISTRDTDGGWSKGQAIPALSGYEAKFGAISPDQSVLFFVTHQQRQDSNPKAVWPLDLFEGPALDANADVYWLSAAETLGTVHRDLR